ncbi:hypothetical protein ACOSQ4_016323 [Xanthoceras sorbifolium]
MHVKISHRLFFSSPSTALLLRSRYAGAALQSLRGLHGSPEFVPLLPFIIYLITQHFSLLFPPPADTTALSFSSQALLFFSVLVLYATAYFRGAARQSSFHRSTTLSLFESVKTLYRICTLRPGCLPQCHSSVCCPPPLHNSVCLL